MSDGECSSESGEMKRSGFGKHTSKASGMTYTGEWHKDKMTGRGALKLASGSVYEGDFKDNMYHGTGTYTFPDGSTYMGNFCKHRLRGEGSFTNPQGLVWTGHFHSKAAAALKLQHNM